MPMFMDVHHGLGEATPEEVQAAHERDLSIQDEYGVRYLTYWFNDPAGRVYCLVEAPDRDSAVACHKAAHGLLPHEIIEVPPPAVEQFLRGWEQHVPNRAMFDAATGDADFAVRAIMFTDMEGSTSHLSREGDDLHVEVLRQHNSIIRMRLSAHGGDEVKHTGDGIMASFKSITRAVDCTIAIQRDFALFRESEPVHGLHVRIGLSAGEPIEDSNDLFGAAVNLAARACNHAAPGQILVSSAIKELCIGKRIPFEDRGMIALKGFDEPVRMYEVSWRD